MREEKGEMVLEMTLVFPWVMIVVVSMLYLGLFKLQESAVTYAVFRIAHQGSMVMSNPGYASLAEAAGYSGKQMDFSTEPSQEMVKDYYEASHENAMVLYREIFGLVGKAAWKSEAELQGEVQEIVDSISFFSGMRHLTTQVKLKNGFFTNKVEASVSYHINMPGVTRFFGMQDSYEIGEGAYAGAVNPAGFVRNVDFACDAVVFASEKLGLKDNLDAFINKTNEILTKVL